MYYSLYKAKPVSKTEGEPGEAWVGFASFGGIAFGPFNASVGISTLFAVKNTRRILCFTNLSSGFNMKLMTGISELLFGVVTFLGSAMVGYGNAYEAWQQRGKYWDDIIMSEMSVGANIGAGMVFSWTDKLGDLAGLSAGAEGGFDQRVYTIDHAKSMSGYKTRGGFGVGGSISTGISVKEYKWNSALTFSLNVTTGVSAHLKIPINLLQNGNWISFIVYYAYPVNMLDWNFPDDL